MQYVFLILAAVGHVILWVALINRAHALGIKRKWVHALTYCCLVMLAIMPAAVMVAFISIFAPQPTFLNQALFAAAWIYLAACAVVCMVAAIQRLYWRFHTERRQVLTSNHTTKVKVKERVAGGLTAPGVATWLGRVPFNEIHNIWIQEKQLKIPRLSEEYAGLKIVHLSDLHMSGRIHKAFYEFVVDEVNRFEPDIVAITGDIVDRDDCIDWIPDTLGRLRASSGVYFVLGNHDRRVNHTRLLQVLAEAGLVHVGGILRPLAVGKHDLVLAGNELPWFGPASDLSGCAQHNGAGMPLRIALSHSPDQLAWACDNKVDLLLAGHVHGGQVCAPILGPFTAPSMHGVRYAAGTFRVGNTVMHVSRGTSSLTPIRWNCPPEIAVLTLNAAKC